MGGRPSKSARCAPRERAFLLVSWDATFLNRMMRTPTVATTTDLEAAQGSTPAPGIIPDLSQVFAVAPPPVVDARRLLTLVESSQGTDFTRWVRTRLVLFTPEMATSLAQLHQNTRLWHIFRRRLYYPILGPRELQAQFVNRALHRFQRRSRRRGRGVMVIVAGDGSLEATASFAASLRAMLRWGHRLEIWSWDGAVPPLYKVLAGEVGEGRVHVRYLNEHRQAIRYQPGRRMDNRGGAAATAAAGGGGGSSAAPLPVAMPMAVPVEGGGAFAMAHAQAPLAPLGKDDGGEADRAAAAMAGLKIGEDGEVVEGEGEGEEEESEDNTSDEDMAQHRRQGQQESAADDPDEDDDAPEPFLDPLTMEVMVDPVLTPSGHTYERAVIVEEVRRRALDPLTQQPLREEDLRPNRALREMIELWRSQRQQVGGMEGRGGGGGKVGKSKGGRG